MKPRVTPIHLVAILALSTLGAMQTEAGAQSSQTTIAIQILQSKMDSQAGRSVPVRAQRFRAAEGASLALCAPPRLCAPMVAQTEMTLSNGVYVGTAALSGHQDIGQRFDIGVAAFDGVAHTFLDACMKKSQASGDFQPI